MEAATATSDAISTLGQELKQWEKNFAACNSGKKPSRQDIKQDAVIAAKYKEYQALRDAQHQPSQPFKKRKRENHDDNHSRHHKTTVQTPQKSRPTQESKPNEQNDHNHPPTPSLAFIGPTPQKDGHVLGLFDRLPGSVTPAQTTRVALDPLDENALISTPTKSLIGANAQSKIQQTDTTDLEISTPALRHRRTPQSSGGKRFLLDKFVTPSKRRFETDNITPHSERQSNAHSTTPSFLRRPAASLLPQIPEDPHSPQATKSSRTDRPPGFKRKSLTRSLSTMIAEMRAAEEAKLDEELDLLREMEGDVDAPSRPTAPSTSQVPSTSILVEDSQIPTLPRPDGASDSEPEPSETQKEGTGRTWKKKGQKRQTRRVIMKPALPKSSLPATSAGGQTPGDAEQADGKTKENGDEEQADELDHSASPSKLRKTAKKISATAHANFRRLKIRSSKGAKAAAGTARGGKGRFGKRRK